MQTPIPLNDEVVLFERFGKKIVSRNFQNPKDGTAYEYVFLDTRLHRPSMVFPVTETGEVVLLRQFRHAVHAYVYEIPGGNPEKNNPDESPIDVVRRELAEETGYVPKNILSLTKDPIWFEPANFSPAYYPFLATGCELEKNLNLDSEECLEVCLVPLPAWLNMIRSGEVLDSKTLALTLLALPRLGMTIA